MVPCIDRLKRVVSIVSIAALAAVFWWGSLACSGCGGKSNAPPPEVEGIKQEQGVVALGMGGVEVFLEVSADFQKRRLGLMKRHHLDQDRGMIFVYPEPDVLRFWMKETWIPLSIAFLRDDGTIINIEKMREMVIEPPYMSREPCRFAIEMNSGWFEKHKLAPGDRIELTEEILSIEAE